MKPIFRTKAQRHKQENAPANVPRASVRTSAPLCEEKTPECRLNRLSLNVLLLLVCGVLAVSLSGCKTFDHQLSSEFPFIVARDDVIEGLDPPHVRVKIIREKGEKGAAASESDREILAAQLMYEYKTSPDPNMRREAVDALAKIPHADRDRFLEEIARDDNPYVRMSALEALGNTYSGSEEDLTAVLLSRAKTDPDRDVRITSVRILGDVTPKVPGRNAASESAGEARLRESVILELGELLHDRVPAVRYESMQSLRKITGKDYGNDINRWLQFVRYTRGEIPDLPSERTFTEKLPTIALPMFK